MRRARACGCGRERSESIGIVSGVSYLALGRHRWWSEVVCWMCEWREGEAERLNLYLGIGNEARFDPRQLRTRDHGQNHYGVKQPFTPLLWDYR